jgi:hypothetical protein
VGERGRQLRLIHVCRVGAAAQRCAAPCRGARPSAGQAAASSSGARIPAPRAAAAAHAALCSADPVPSPSCLQASIQAAATVWGLEVLRYEIRDIMPPSAVRNAMELQAEAERRKRAQVGLRGRLTGAGVPGCATSWRCFLGGGVGGGIRNVMELPLCGVAG